MPVYEYECPKCGAKKTRQVFGTFTLLGSSKSEGEFDDDLGADDYGGGDDFGGDDLEGGDDDLDL